VTVSPVPSVRRLARKRRSAGDEDPLPLSLSYKVHIASVNNFPTAAGLASSAAGYACLAYALARVYGVESDLSEVARRGSGSACRSLYGGFVEWQMGERADGKDSIARQVAPESHWPELRVLILVVSAEKKLMGSTAGMQSSVETSSLLRVRLAVAQGTSCTSQRGGLRLRPPKPGCSVRLSPRRAPGRPAGGAAAPHGSVPCSSGLNR